MWNAENTNVSLSLRRSGRNSCSRSTALNKSDLTQGTFSRNPACRPQCGFEQIVIRSNLVLLALVASLGPVYAGGIDPEQARHRPGDDLPIVDIC